MRAFLFFSTTGIKRLVWCLIKGCLIELPSMWYFCFTRQAGIVALTEKLWLYISVCVCVCVVNSSEQRKMECVALFEMQAERLETLRCFSYNSFLFSWGLLGPLFHIVTSSLKATTFRPLCNSYLYLAHSVSPPASHTADCALTTIQL